MFLYFVLGFAAIVIAFISTMKPPGTSFFLYSSLSTMKPLEPNTTKHEPKKPTQTDKPHDDEEKSDSLQNKNASIPKEYLPLILAAQSRGIPQHPALDFNRPNKIIRQYGTSEEDLQRTIVVDDKILERLKSYVPKRPRQKKAVCRCQDTSSPGVAPLVTLNNGRKMPTLGLGTWLGFREDGSTIVPTDNSVQQAVEAAIDAGYRLVDTAAVYETERMVGRGINSKIKEKVVERSDLFIITKLWNADHAKDAVVPALKTSLAKLHLDYLDLYLMHFPVSLHANGSLSDIDYLETWEGMIEARARGLTKAIGVSNFNLEQLNRLIRLSSVKPAVLEIEVNLNLQEPDLLAFCRAHNITVIAYTPFGSLFHNKAKPGAPPPRTDDQTLLKIADKYKKTVAQVALRYLLDLGVVPIPKSVKPKRISENIGVFDFVLTKPERELLKQFDRRYRMLDVSVWKESPYYPFNEY